MSNTSLNDIIEQSAEILGLQDALEAARRTDFVPSAEDANFCLLARCANLVAANVASNYFDCMETQTFMVDNWRINFSQFSRTFLKVIEVTQGGQSVAYDLFTSFLSVPNGNVTVKYACVPQFTLGNANPRTVSTGIVPIAAAAFAYGVAAEYAYISGMFNEAKVWNEKFEELLFGARKTGRVKKLPIGW